MIRLLDSSPCGQSKGCLPHKCNEFMKLKCAQCLSFQFVCLLVCVFHAHLYFPFVLHFSSVFSSIFSFILFILTWRKNHWFNGFHTRVTTWLLLPSSSFSALFCYQIISFTFCSFSLCVLFPCSQLLPSFFSFLMVIVWETSLICFSSF